MQVFELFREIIASLPETSEELHFNKRSFKVKKKIFATLNEKENRATVKLSEIDQYAFCAFDRELIYAVPNKWGKLGWTHINLRKANQEILHDILKIAYCTVAPARLAAQVNQ